MRNFFYICSIIWVLSPAAYAQGLADEPVDSQVINHEIAARIEKLKGQNGYSSEDFNACQITWTVQELQKEDTHSKFQPHEITFQYENKEIIKIVNKYDGDAQSIQGLGLNCLEFNNYVYLFFDTLDFETRLKFDLKDLSYVVYSSDKGVTWSNLIGLDPFSVKAKFILPQSKFKKYLKIFGDNKTHALSIFMMRPPTCLTQN